MRAPAALWWLRLVFGTEASVSLALWVWTIRQVFATLTAPEGLDDPDVQLALVGGFIALAFTTPLVLGSVLPLAAALRRRLPYEMFRTAVVAGVIAWGTVLFLNLRISSGALWAYPWIALGVVGLVALLAGTVWLAHRPSVVAWFTGPRPRTSSPV